MIISYLGKQFFRINHGDLTIATNPSGKQRFGADVVFASTLHPDHNNPDLVSFGDKRPFVIKGPGEYEVKEVTAEGFGGEIEIGKKKYQNTIYNFTLNDIKICFLGLAKELSSEVREAIEEPDILFVSIGDDPSKAYKISVSLEPKIVIPMDFEPGGKEIKTFLKEGGSKAEPIEKLTIKKKELADKEGEIVILKQ
jgi:L-ascorbate metabolism protein UlaG (beta-lactamase superfamily)